MGQSRLWSALEALANVAVGLTVATVANLIILPAFGVPVTVLQAAVISVAFTAVSLARSYVMRRIFNKIERGRNVEPE
jgi:hypothetical protein